MNNQQFIKYTADRYGLDENTIETMVDIFAVALQEIIHAGHNIIIDEIGEFLPEQTLSYQSKQHTVSFKPSQKLVTKVA